MLAIYSHSFFHRNKILERKISRNSYTWKKLKESKIMIYTTNEVEKVKLYIGCVLIRRYVLIAFMKRIKTNRKADIFYAFDPKMSKWNNGVESVISFRFIFKQLTLYHLYKQATKPQYKQMHNNDTYVSIIAIFYHVKIELLNYWLFTHLYIYNRIIVYENCDFFLNGRIKNAKLRPVLWFELQGYEL